MTAENTAHSTQRGNGNQRRRKRRRSRRRAGSANAVSHTSKSASSPRDSEAKKNSTKSSSKRRSRGKRGRSGNQRSQHKRNNRSGNRRRSQPRMVTRNETSAGGLVISGLPEAVADNGDVDLSRIYVALIGRLDRRGRLLWSMPKGHVEPGEDRETTAEREVWEETGIHGEVIEGLGVIDYWFVSDGVRIHKTVHHFLLRYIDGELNDEDPEVTEVSWIAASTLIEHLAYADERKLARRAHDRLTTLAREEKAAGRVTPR